MNHAPRFIPLAIRISTIVVGVVAAIGLAATVFLVNHLAKDTEAQFVQRGQTLSLILAKLVSEGIAEENLDLVNRASYIIREKDVVQVCVYNEFWGRIEVYPQQTGSVHEPELPPTILAAANFFASSPEARFFYTRDDHGPQHVFFARVFYQPFHDAPPMDAGFVVVHLSDRQLATARREMVRTHLATAALFSLVTILLLVWLLHVQVVKPLKGLHREMEDFTRQGAPPAPPPTVRDEVGELKRQFSEMARTIRRRERESHRFQQELQRSNQELEQFAYVASHDLQEPLRVISGFVQLLEKRQGDKIDAKGREHMAHIVEATGRMKELINDLLSYSRLSTKARPPEAVDLNQVVTRVEANLAQLIAENVAVIDCPEPLPTVRAEAGQMTMLLQNLLTNAVRYRRNDQPPRITITARRENGTWRLAVADNGIGIEQQYFDRIFKIFQRLHTRDEYPGTGIGLAICRKIVERHRGRLWVESTPGRGSTFYFTLPKGESEPAEGSQP
ncbi:sensor histidine kinase [Desulfurivibrio dismutans]|uniref:sensor histidine kinase n=1 Tax=Desulfurivibrio dismutans TaxID=1398908 RepID=UPI0023DCABB1|nr:ATP-binding protein [Desulfurivibrio alkaliphilus]MDF1613799.1 ATP-binding protein [Desulfurivibrio alkaliphilus]